MIWKCVKDYEGLYWVSDTGLVRSKKKVLKQWKRSKYLLVDLWKNGNRDVRSVHVLVYETFVELIPNGYVIHHKDGDRFNNCVDNLEMLTQLEHNRHHHCGKEPWNKGKSPSMETIAKRVSKMKSRYKDRNQAIIELWRIGVPARVIAFDANLCTRFIYQLIKEYSNDKI